MEPSVPRTWSAEELLPLVYDELRALARKRLAGGREGVTLQPTALVHEVWMRLVAGGDPGWDSRRHFFGAAAQAMRRVLVDHHRARTARRRSGRVQGEDFESLLDAYVDEGGVSAEEVLLIDGLFERLAQESPRAAEVASLRFFLGLTNDQIAALHAVTERTVERDWRFARAWLQDMLQSGGGAPPGE